MNEYNQITIVGCGLLGGSFALALRRAGYTGLITACGGSRGPRIALERQIIDAIETSFEQNGLCQSDVIFLAAPVGAIIDFLKSHSDQIKLGALVTDAGSTKVEICRVARESLPPEVHFVGGHPMAGSENTGIEYARADLFDGATWALMSDNEIHNDQRLALESLITTFGARPLITNPDEHDAAVSLISHLPQLLSSTLANLLVEGENELAQQLAATGWRDMTRLAGSSWSVWRDILMTNASSISDSMEQMIVDLQSLKEALDQRDFNRVRELFQSANDAVERHRQLRYQSFKKL